MSPYNAIGNPFHNVNLSQQFRWHKKAEKKRKQGLTVAEAQRRDALRRQEAKEELECLNKRRARAVDLLALNLCYGNLDPNKDGGFDLDAADMEIDLNEPYNIFDVGLSFHSWQGFVCSPAPQNLSLQ